MWLCARFRHIAGHDDLGESVQVRVLPLALFPTSDYFETSVGIRPKSVSLLSEKCSRTFQSFYASSRSWRLSLFASLMLRQAGR